jgi:hypothetical protein
VTEDRHDEVRGLLAPYVLGAVTEEETALIRPHLVSCDECMREADDLSAAASSLALSVAPASLPAGFSERVLERAVEGRPAARAEAAPGRRPPWLRWQLGGLAALAAVGALLGIGLVDARRDADRERALLRAALERSAMAMAGEGGAVGRMVPTSEGAVLVAAGLEPAPEGRDYQLWLLRDCGETTCPPTSAGTFDGARGLVVYETDRSLDEVVGVAVTLERDGGADAPTTDPVIRTV